MTRTPVRLLLVRHALTADVGRRLTGRADGVPLSPEGEAQARALARRLGADGLDGVLTSPRERARATAAAVAAATGAPLAIEPALDEIHFGDWTGATFADLEGRPEWDAWNRARGTARAPAGESMAEVADRALVLVQRLVATRGGARIALVSHCDVIRGLVARLIGLPLDHLLRLDADPASLARVNAGEGWAVLRSLNDTAHLAPSTAFRKDAA